MADEKEPRFYLNTPDERQEEQKDTQDASTFVPGPVAESAQHEPESYKAIGQQQLDELSRTIEGLMADMENHQFQPDPVTLRRLQQFMEKNAERLRKLEAKEPMEPVVAEPNALERFVQFSEDFVREVSEKANELHGKEAQYQDGDLTEEEYREVSEERQKFMREFEDKIYELARPVHIDHLREVAGDPSVGDDDADKREAKKTLESFDLAHAYLVEKLGPMVQLEPDQRLLLFWGRLEKHFLSFKSAYDQLLSVYELRQAAYHLGKAELADVNKALEDLNAAWGEKRDAFERMKLQLSHKRGFSDDDKMELEERARIVLQPEAPAPMSFESEQTRPFKRPELSTEEDLPTLELTEDDENEKPILELKQQVTRWAEVATTLEDANKLTPDVCTELLGELSKYEEKLTGIDTQGDRAEAAKERVALEKLIQELRAKLEFSRDYYINPSADDVPHEKQEAKAANATEARSAYHEVVAAYTAVQHTLSDDQRRDIRTRIARMAGLVRQAELSDAVAHATEHAPAIAHATLASMPVVPRRYEVKTIPLMQTQPQPRPTKASRSMFGALGDAFRLK